MAVKLPLFIFQLTRMHKVQTTLRTLCIHLSSTAWLAIFGHHQVDIVTYMEIYTDVEASPSQLKMHKFLLLFSTCV